MNAHARFPALDGFEVEHDFDDIPMILDGLEIGSFSGDCMLIGDTGDFYIARISLHARAPFRAIGFPTDTVLSLVRPTDANQSDHAKLFRAIEAAILAAGKAWEDFWHQFENREIAA